MSSRESEDLKSGGCGLPIASKLDTEFCPECCEPYHSTCTLRPRARLAAEKLGRPLRRKLQQNLNKAEEFDHIETVASEVAAHHLDVRDAGASP